MEDTDRSPLPSQTSTLRSRPSRDFGGDAPPSGTPRHAATNAHTVFLLFACMGLLNNSVWVIMNGGAKDMAGGATGVIYAVNMIPSLCIRLFGPYTVLAATSHKQQLYMVALAMFIGCALVGFGEVLSIRLVGVAFVSLGSGLGEPTMLTLSSTAQSYVAAYSSGTGFAGFIGYALLYVADDDHYFAFVRLCAVVFPLAWIGCFRTLLYHLGRKSASTSLSSSTEARHTSLARSSTISTSPLLSEENISVSNLEDARHPPPTSSEKPLHFTSRDRFRLFLRLLSPYGVPLFLVYFCEYLCQSGVWSAIGIPHITSPRDRERFYRTSNWAYQFGVLLSRSLAAHPVIVRRASVASLYGFAFHQVIALVFFVWDVRSRWIWNWFLHVLAFAVGIVGGAAWLLRYVLLQADETLGDSRDGDDDDDDDDEVEVEEEEETRDAIERRRRRRTVARREFAMQAMGLADQLGTLASTFLAVVVQGCLYAWYDGGANPLREKDGSPPLFRCGNDEYGNNNNNNESIVT